MPYHCASTLDGGGLNRIGDRKDGERGGSERQDNERLGEHFEILK
jgi:hypothetical protein